MPDCSGKTVLRFTWSRPRHWSLPEFFPLPFRRQPRPCFALVAYTFHRMLKIQDRACKLLLATNQTLELLRSHLEFFPLHCIPSLFPLSHSPYNHCGERMFINHHLRKAKGETSWLKMCQRTQNQSYIPSVRVSSMSKATRTSFSCPEKWFLLLKMGNLFQTFLCNIIPPLS
jgi:hypothetical protein